MRTIMIIALLTFCTLFPVISQTITSTVSVSQWQDSWLAKWQSTDPIDKKESMEQLAALLLIIDKDSPLVNTLTDKLVTYSGISSSHIDVAIAFQGLRVGFPDKAAEGMLDLILKHQNDFRVNRFRIGLARAFRQTGQFELAAAQIDPIVDLRTSDGRWATLERARIYQSQNDSKHAIELYKSIQNSDATSYLKQTAHREQLETSFRSVLSDEIITE